MTGFGTLLVIIAAARAVAVLGDNVSTAPPMYPCAKEIVFGIDATWTQTNSDSTFEAVKLFLTSNLVTDQWTNFDRIALRFWAKNYTSGPETFYNRTMFDNAVNKGKKFQSQPSIEEGLEMLWNTHTPTPYNDRTVVMFTTSSDPLDVQNAAYWAWLLQYYLIVVAVSPASRQNLLPLVMYADNVILFNPHSPKTWDWTADYIRSKIVNYNCGQPIATTTTSPISTSSPSGCVDTIANCEEYSASCGNGLYRQFMCMYCKKTCNLCRGECSTLQ